LSKTHEVIKGEGQAEGPSQDGRVPAESFNMRKRISSTTYEVTVHFSRTNGETLDEKILRLARSDALNEGAGQSESNE
jgi:hypothetical protein